MIVASGGGAGASNIQMYIWMDGWADGWTYVCMYGRTRVSTIFPISMGDNKGTWEKTIVALIHP